MPNIFESGSIEQYTPGQTKALTEIESFINGSERTYVLSGFAGTGKTSLVENIYNYVSKVKKKRCAIMSITHRALHVISARFPFIKDHTYTIHSALYGPPDSHMQFRIGSPKEIRDIAEFFIIDEASMIPLQILQDIWKVQENAKIIYIGDNYQLPPVGDDQTILNNSNCQLSDVVRHDSGILNMATTIRKIKRSVAPSEDMNGVSLFQGSPVDVFLMSPDDSVIVTALNNSRIVYNMLIHKRLQGESPLTVGDPLLCISNNSIYTNGAMFRITEVITIGDMKIVNVQTQKGFQKIGYMRCKVRLEDGGVCDILLTPNIPFASVQNSQIPELVTYDDYSARPIVNKNVVICTYGYAITCHKAQGGQWDTVVVDHNGFHEEPRWLYTALTRAQRQVWLKNTNYNPSEIMTVEEIERIARG